MMRCPKCGFDQLEGSVECVKCGIIFEKYLSRQQGCHKSADLSLPNSHSEVHEKSCDKMDLLKNLLFHIGPELNVFYLSGRAFLLLAVIIVGVKLIFSSVESNYAGTSFMHLINMPFHEAGHLLFRIFGQFMMTLGGSLMQLLIPLICLSAFLVKTKDTFAASISLWWFGESMIDLAPYINDARALNLILLGGVIGKDVDDYHDWEFILRKLGMLEYDHLLAGIVHIMGALLIACAMLWGAFLLFKQYKRPDIS